MEWITTGLTAFALIVPVELPDKTFVATLVLATRYRPLPVWLGVAAAFAVQCALAVTAGGLLALLPERPVRFGAGVLFAIGAFVLFHGARAADAEEPDEAEAAEETEETEKAYEKKVTDARRGWHAAGASFLVLFVAEWGDLSQLLAAGLVAAGRPPVPVFLGAWLGLVCVAGAGVLLGRALLRHIRLSAVRYVGAAVCAVLAIATIISALVQNEAAIQ